MKTKILIVMAVTLLSIGFCALQAQAYTELKTPVTLTSQGTLAGVTETFAVTAVDQSTGSNPSSAVNFTAPAGVSDSGRALKIQGGTNVVNARIIIYTENNLNTTPHMVPTIDPTSGVDGAGLVGQTNAGYAVPLIWGVKCAANNDPNTNSDYVFDGTVDGVGETFIVDKRHNTTFTGLAAGAGLDNVAMYKADGTSVANTANDAKYPQLWAEDLYDSTTPATRVVLSPALYKTIATAAFSVASSGSAYVCTVPKISTSDPTDNVSAQLGAPTTGAAVYLAIGGDFTGKPAQTYSTGNLKLAIVQD